RTGSGDDFFSQAGGWHPIPRIERGIETAQARKSAGKSDLNHGQARFGEELLGPEQPAGLKQLNRGHSQFLPDDAADLSRAEPKFSGDGFERALLICQAFLDAL